MLKYFFVKLLKIRLKAVEPQLTSTVFSRPQPQPLLRGGNGTMLPIKQYSLLCVKLWEGREGRGEGGGQ